MNLRISENHFRFRVTPDDLDALLSGQRLEQKFAIGGKDFQYGISPSISDGMRLDVEPAKISLCVPHQMLEELCNLGRSKEGLFVAQGDIEVALQLDIKTQKRNAA